MGENFRASFQSIWAHKMRSFLTMLGVIIGIAAIIAIVSTIKGTNEQIMQNLIGAGNNNVTVSLKQGEGDLWMDSGAPQGVRTVSDAQKDEIRSLDTVADATFFLKRDWVDGIARNDITLNGGKILGIDSHYLSTCGYLVFEGRAFLEKDFTSFQKVALLDETAAKVLFPEDDPIDQVIDIKGEPFTIVGLIRKSDQFKPVINSFQDYQTYNQEEYGTVFIPDASWPIIFLYDEPENCTARAVRTEDMSDVGRDVAAIMQTSITNASSEISYKAEDLLERARNQQELSSSTNKLLIWVASIALLVGGIGVMNIMLVSVTERTAEIGLKKALGARKRRILGQFLTESAVLTSLGGVLGVVAGIVLAFAISRMTQTPVAISVPAILLGVGFSMLIGILFGLLPSVKAANLNPIEALRRE